MCIIYVHSCSAVILPSNAINNTCARDKRKWKLIVGWTGCVSFLIRIQERCARCCSQINRFRSMVAFIILIWEKDYRKSFYHRRVRADQMVATDKWMRHLTLIIELIGFEMTSDNKTTWKRSNLHRNATTRSCRLNRSCQISVLVEDRREAMITGGLNSKTHTEISAEPCCLADSSEACITSPFRAMNSPYNYGVNEFGSGHRITRYRVSAARAGSKSAPWVCTFSSRCSTSSIWLGVLNSQRFNQRSAWTDLVLAVLILYAHLEAFKIAARLIACLERSSAFCTVYLRAASFSALLSGKYVQRDLSVFLCVFECRAAAARANNAQKVSWRTHRRKFPTNDHLWKVALVNVLQFRTECVCFFPIFSLPRVVRHNVVRFNRSMFTFVTLADFVHRGLLSHWFTANLCNGALATSDLVASALLTTHLPQSRTCHFLSRCTFCAIQKQ